MGVRILEDKESGQTCFYCSTSMWAFGCVMEDAEEADAFLSWLEDKGTRIRMVSDQEHEKLYYDFRRERAEAKEKAEKEGVKKEDGLHNSEKID